MKEKMMTNRKNMRAAEIWNRIGGQLLAWRQGSGPIHDSWATSITIEGEISGQRTVDALSRMVAKKRPSGAFDSFYLHWEVTNDGRTDLWWKEIY